MKVLNIRLNWRGSVHSPVLPQEGHCALSSASAPLSASRMSTRKRRWQLRHSTRGSLNSARCPEASHTFGCMRIAASSPSMSSRRWTIERHHASLTFRLSSTPSGP